MEEKQITLIKNFRSDNTQTYVRSSDSVVSWSIRQIKWTLQMTIRDCTETTEPGMHGKLTEREIVHWNILSENFYNLHSYSPIQYKLKLKK